ncbi:N-(5'-phosphoribosyl)anthranilate isomerase [Parvularcula marina]|uniref:phosphoribosylanthranilate isomerase n=1 Tax=Parvularcula marina TaxID=2292771 RepID=UPI003513BCA9
MQYRFDIKICGLTTQDAVEAAIDAGATMIGFVFASVSPRYVTPEKAADLAELARGKAQIVGLFADQGAEEISAIRDSVGLDIVQIHGRESRAERFELVRAFPDCMLAKGIWQESDLPGEDDPAPGSWIFDALPPDGYKRQGGHGMPFDWSALKAYRGETPFILAGGLTPANVADAIRACDMFPAFSGVDVSSGVERSRGVKDPKRIAAFVEAALAARAALRTS